MGQLTFTTVQLDEGTIIENTNNSRVGGDKSIRTQGTDSLDVQTKRDAADFSHLYWSGIITSFEDAGTGNVKALYGGGLEELEDGDIVTIADTTNYNGTYTIHSVITDVEDSFEFIATWVISETGTWTAQRLYDRLTPDENKNDNNWSLEAQTEFMAQAPNATDVGERCMSLSGWGDDWSQNTWGIILGYQNIGGGIGTNILGNNNIAENYWCSIIGDHNHISEWSTRAFGSWNVGQGGDGLLLGSDNDTYGWKVIAVGNKLNVAGNESQSYGDSNTIHDAFGIDLNETPDALHNRFNIAIGRGITIGSESDLGDKATGSITAFTDAGTPIDHTIVSSLEHGLLDGDAVEITGTTNYDGKYRLDGVTTDTFLIGIAYVVDDATGTWTQNYTVNNVVAIGTNLSTEKDGAVMVGENLINNYDRSIEMGASDDRKLSIRKDGRIITPSPASGVLAEPQITDDTLDSYLPLGHSTQWYYEELGADKLFIYRHDIVGGLQKCQIGGSFGLA